MKKDTSAKFNIPELENAGIFLNDKKWRMSNLYWILDKEGEKVKFVPNAVQEDFLYKMTTHSRTIVLKSRQHGLSTCCLIDFLDNCLFTQNHKTYVICHTIDDAKELLATKVKFPYDNLPDVIKQLVVLKTDSKEVLEWANGSSLKVDTSVRSTNAHALHISELGKISKANPEKAREIKTGALNAIKAGLRVTIESTAEGNSGMFYDYCQKAMTMKASREPLTAVDFNFVFYSWFMDCTNTYSDEDTAKVRIPTAYGEYFRSLDTDWQEIDIEMHKKYFPLSENQKAWYYKKAEEQGEDMKQEHPSTPTEAFNQSLEGAYYETQFAKIDDAEITRCGVTDVPYPAGSPVYTVWDLGMADEMAIIFYTRIGTEIRVLNSYTNSGEGFQHYASMLSEYRNKYGYNYVHHYAPHDIQVREMTTGKSRLELARGFGIHFTVIPQLSIAEGIDACRQALSTCFFDRDKCATDNPNQKSKGAGKYSLVSCLRLYRKEWDEKRGCFKDRPLHDFTSHYADAMRYLAVSLDMQHVSGSVRRKALPISKKRFII